MTRWRRWRRRGSRSRTSCPSSTDTSSDNTCPDNHCLPPSAASAVSSSSPIPPRPPSLILLPPHLIKLGLEADVPWYLHQTLIDSTEAAAVSHKQALKASESSPYELTTPSPITLSQARCLLVIANCSGSHECALLVDKLRSPTLGRRLVKLTTGLVKFEHRCLSLNAAACDRAILSTTLLRACSRAVTSCSEFFSSSAPPGVVSSAPMIASIDCTLTAAPAHTR
eukprot:767619-Hanusia_phi.AAC.6